MLPRLNQDQRHDVHIPGSRSFAWLAINTDDSIATVLGRPNGDVIDCGFIRRKGSAARRAPKRHDQNGQKSDCVSHVAPNDRDEQLAAKRLSMPNDSAASLLHRLVRGAVGFPLTRSLGHRRERFRPVVKSGRIKISAIRPNEGVNLWV